MSKNIHELVDTSKHKGLNSWLHVAESMAAGYIYVITAAILFGIGWVAWQMLTNTLPTTVFWIYLTNYEPMQIVLIVSCTIMVWSYKCNPERFRRAYTTNMRSKKYWTSE